MSAMITELEEVVAPMTGGQKPKLAIRGPRRRQAKKALKSLQTIMNEDAREQRRSEKYQYAPLPVMGNPGSTDNNAFKRAIGRLMTILAARV